MSAIPPNKPSSSSPVPPEDQAKQVSKSVEDSTKTHETQASQASVNWNDPISIKGTLVDLGNKIVIAGHLCSKK